MKSRRINEKALVPGSFDPVTRGHLQLIAYAAKKYKKVYATVFVNKDKTCTFSKQERVAMLRKVCARYKNVQVDADDGMLWEYARDRGITVTVRGWRDEKDLAYEREMADFNANANPKLRTELVKSREELTAVSSSAVRALLGKGEKVDRFVPAPALSLLLQYAGKGQNS